MRINELNWFTGTIIVLGFTILLTALGGCAVEERRTAVGKAAATAINRVSVDAPLLALDCLDAYDAALYGGAGDGKAVDACLKAITPSIVSAGLEAAPLTSEAYLAYHAALERGLPARAAIRRGVLAAVRAGLAAKQ